MRKKAPFIILYLFIASLPAISQTRKITGLVTSADKRESNASIKNVSANTHAISNDIGEFTITAKTDDTLIISKNNFINDTLHVTDEQYFVIKLKKDPVMLKEVVVNSTFITPAKTYAENKKEYKDIYWKGDKSHMIVITPIGIGANIDKIYNALSTEGKDARKMQRTLTNDYKNSVIDRKFNKALVGRITGYKSEVLFNFMNKYRPGFEMVSKYTDYEMIRYIKRSMVKERHVI